METLAKPRLDDLGSISLPRSSHVSVPAYERFFGVGIALVDAIVIFFSGVVVLYLRFAGQMAGSSLLSNCWSNPDYRRYLAVFVIFAVLTILASNSYRLYEVVQRRSILDEGLSLLQAIAVASVLLTTLLYFAKASQVSRPIVGFTGFVAFWMLLCWRAIKRDLVRRQMVDGYGCRNALIVGTGETGRMLARYLNTNSQLGYKVCGFMAERDEDGAESADVLGHMEDFRAIVMANFIDDIVITVPVSNEEIRQLVLSAQECGISVRVVPDWLGLYWTSQVQQLGDFPAICLYERHLPATSLALKRAIDIAFSLSTLIMLAPLFLAIALLIKLDSKGSVFYCSKRVGRRGREFECYKFRTMVSDAERKLPELLARNERSGILFKIKDDPRVTRVGRWLRKYSFDELPQFWNVLKGDMSVVGPRPAILSEVRRYKLEHLKRIDMTPGITGLWQITARCSPSYQHYIQCDLDYTANWSLRMDLEIMLKTIPAVLKGTGQ